jgi:hypothetical protein
MPKFDQMWATSSKCATQSQPEIVIRIGGGIAQTEGH